MITEPDEIKEWLLEINELSKSGNYILRDIKILESDIISCYDLQLELKSDKLRGYTSLKSFGDTNLIEQVSRSCKQIGLKLGDYETNFINAFNGDFYPRDFYDPKLHWYLLVYTGQGPNGSTAYSTRHVGMVCPYVDNKTIDTYNPNEKSYIITGVHYQGYCTKREINGEINGE